MLPSEKPQAPQSRESEALEPQAHEVSTVASFMSDLVLLTKTDPEAFKKKLFAHWAKIKEEGA